MVSRSATDRLRFAAAETIRSLSEGLAGGRSLMIADDFFASLSTAYGVCRIKRLKGPGGIALAAAHNLREIETPNADNHAPTLGGGIEVLEGPSTAAEVAEAERCLHARHGVPKPRQDAVRGMEFVLSASPSWFETATDEDKRAWAGAALDFAKEQFPVEGSIISAVLHDDESSLHIQVIGVPLNQKTRKKGGRPPRDPEKRRRWEKRQATSAELTVALDARGLFNGKKRFRELQDAYGTAMAPFGIARGRPKGLTGAEHRHHDAWKAERMNAAKQSERRSWAVYHAQKAIIAGDLVYSPKRGDLWPTKQAEKKAKAEETPVHTPVRSWRSGAGSLWGGVVAFGKRWREMLDRERDVRKQAAALDRREADLSKLAAEVKATAQGLEAQRQQLRGFAVAAFNFARMMRPRSTEGRSLADKIAQDAPSWASEHRPPAVLSALIQQAEKGERAALRQKGRAR